MQHYTLDINIKNISAHSYETYEISKNLKLRGLPAKCFGAKSFPDNAVFTLFGVSSSIYVSTQSNCQQWNHIMNHNYTYNIYLCWRSLSSQQNFETEKLAEFCETKEVYVETKTSPGTWRESGIAESSHLSGALIYFFEWSSYLLNFLRTRRN